jgi:LacI family transcriptional regulator
LTKYNIIVYKHVLISTIWRNDVNSFQIAKLAGVSRSTVSRVINNYPNVPEETRNKVLEVINKYNYVPHASARMLAGKVNKILGLIIVDTKEENIENRVYESSYFSQFTSIVIDKAKKLGYHVLVSEVSNGEDFQSVRDIFYNKTIVGGIFIGIRDNDPAIKEIIAGDQVVAIVGQSTKNSAEEFKKCLIVNPDNYGGAKKAVMHLLSIGCQRIAHLGGDMEQLSGKERLLGYMHALENDGISVDNDLIVEGDFTEESGYKGTVKLLSRIKPDAIFAANDHMAIGAIRAIEEAGLKVPEDISIIGFDDIDIARYVKPALTTVRISLLEVASIITNSLISAVEGGAPLKASHLVPVEFVERDSCRK